MYDYLKKLFLLGFVASCAACTTELNAVRIQDNPADVPLSGAPYNLSFTQFDITVTQRVARCFRKWTPEESEAHSGQKYDLSSPDAQISVTAVISKSEARDPLRNYVIDLNSLESFFKTTSVEASYYESGVLKGLNAAAEDKTGEFISSTVGTLAKLASAAMAQNFVAPDTCEKKTKEHFDEAEMKAAELEALTPQLVAATEAVKQHIALATALGRATPAADKIELAKDVKALLDLSKKQIKLEKELASELAAISIVTKSKWPANGEEFVSSAPIAKPVDNTKSKWFTTISPGKLAASAAYFEIRASEGIGRVLPCGSKCVEDNVDHKGFKYRMPSLGKLYMCSALTNRIEKDGSKSEAKTCAAESDADLYQTDAKEAMISQLGRIYILPLKSTLFSSKSITATFSETGVPTKVGLTASAASDKLGASLGTIAGSAINLHNTKKGREKAALEDQLAILKLKKDIAAYAPAADQDRQDATAEFNADAALSKSESASIEARQALEELKKL